MGKIHVETGVIATDVSSTKKYMQEIKKGDLLTRAEEIELSERIAKGDVAARQRLMERNLRFVVQVAKKYQGMGVLLEDLISAGNIGLYEAATRFDGSRGNKFISFAVWYIRSEITKELNDFGRTVRIPSHKTQTEEYGTISTSRPVGAGDKSNPGNEETYADRFLPNEKEMSYRDLEDLKELIEVALSKLPIKEATAVKMFYGIGIEYAKHMEDIAEALDLTSERVRQLIRSGENKLKKLSGIKLLEKYL